MSLQIRRGTEATRTGVIFDSGEIIFTTDTQKLYVGDGITAGGKNVLASSAGTGVSFNNTTQAFDFTRSGLGLTTSDVTEGTNLYYLRQRAQDDAAALFTATGAPTSSGNITATSAPNTVTISGNTTGMVVGEKFTVAGTAGNGLSATTYYIAQVLSIHSVTLSSTRLNALASPQVLVTVTTNASYTGTTYASGGEDSNIVFTYDSVNHTMVANVTLDGVGIGSVQADTTPQLGGNLTLNSKTIQGTGTINMTGTITATGNISTSGGSISASTTVTAGTNVSAASYQGAALTYPVVLQSSAQEAFKVSAINTDGTGANAPTFTLNSSRGTIVSPTNTVASDILTSIQFRGYYGGQYIPAVSVRGQWDAGSVLSSAYAGGSLSVFTGNNNNAFNTLTFNSKGTLSVSGPVQVGLFATGAYPANGPASALTSFVITGIAGQCSCSATTLALGGTITISGTLGGTGTISGYAGGPTTYYIVATNGSTTFTLSATGNGSGITTTAGTPTGLTLSLSLPQKGMIIFDSTSNHFYGYNGTNWVAFTGP